MNTATDVPEARTFEQDKYIEAYSHDEYRMGAARMQEAHDRVTIVDGGSYLDVSTGRGEMLDWARRAGSGYAFGTEIVPTLVEARPDVTFAWVHALPFENDTFDVVTLLDVIEHLIPGDDELACKELARVAKSCVYLTANNKDSFNWLQKQLHINKRPYEEWDRLFRLWFAPHAVECLGFDLVSPMWRVRCGS